jgi:hypothetical protein
MQLSATSTASYQYCICLQLHCAVVLALPAVDRNCTHVLNDVQVFKVSEEILSILEENREQLELLMNWCDLCLPANETAFAEAHRLKVHSLMIMMTT